MLSNNMDGFEICEKLCSFWFIAYQFNGTFDNGTFDDATFVMRKIR
jgi:hypothetical protein